MTHQYFLIIDEAQAGPFTYQELFSKNLTPDTLIWRQGLDDWTRASQLQEVAQVLAATEAANGNRYGQQPNYGRNPQYGQQPNYGQNPQYGQQPNYGQNPQYGQQPNYGQNPQYGQQPNYGRNPQYGQQPNYGQNPQYGQQPNYGQNPQYGMNPNYGQNQSPVVRTNWLNPAIIATVCGFIFSCIGGVFGIVGIIQAGKANDAFMMGYDAVGEQANSLAKTMTIISFVLSGIGLFISLFMLIF